MVVTTDDESAVHDVACLLLLLLLCCCLSVVCLLLVLLLLFVCCCFFVATVVTCSPLLLLEGISHVLKILFGLIQLSFSTAESLTIDFHFCLGYVKLGREEKQGEERGIKREGGKRGNRKGKRREGGKGEGGKRGNRKGERREGGKGEGERGIERGKGGREERERENLKLKRLSHHIHKSASLAVFHSIIQTSYYTACAKCGHASWPHCSSCKIPVQYHNGLLTCTHIHIKQSNEPHLLETKESWKLYGVGLPRYIVCRYVMT